MRNLTTENNPPSGAKRDVEAQLVQMCEYLLPVGRIPPAVLSIEDRPLQHSLSSVLSILQHATSRVFSCSEEMGPCAGEMCA